jgi:hypothetical protein
VVELFNNLDPNTSKLTHVDIESDTFKLSAKALKNISKRHTQIIFGTMPPPDEVNVQLC